MACQEVWLQVKMMDNAAENLWLMKDSKESFNL